MSHKLKFKYEHTPETYSQQHTHKVAVETDAESLPEILEIFQDFLSGCGFSFTNKRIEVVEDER